MRKRTIIVDMGTSNVSVFYKTIVLREPDIALVRRKNGLELVAFGNEALRKAGSIDERMSFINPVSDGVIVNAEVASLVIAHCIGKVVPHRFWEPVELIALIPCGLSIAERENTENAFRKAGFGDVTLVESILGLLPFIDKRGSAAAVIGGGTTEFAVLNDKGIVSACSLNVAGREMDKRIRERVLDSYNISISDFTAEKLKKEIGSLYINNMSSAEVAGRGILDKTLRKEMVGADVIRPALTWCYKKIVEVAESLFTTIPSDMIAQASARGLYLAGGGAALEGVQDYFAKYLRIPVVIDPEPETAVLRGIGELAQSGRLKEILRMK